jgi:antirestriction protein ArdC
MLISSQRPEAMQVAGFRKWQQLGRQVRKGEKAIKILCYSTKKITSTDPSTGQEVEDRVTRFPILSVFDISQTEGDEVPAAVYSLPTGDGPVGVLDRLTVWLQAEGWTVQEEPLAAGLEGYTDHTGHLIATKTGLDPAARLVVLLHEAAHALLHPDSADYVARRGLCETEAESVAYVLATLLGVDVDASSISYIAGWSHATPEILTAAATNVLRAVNTIAAALGLDDNEESADAAQREETAA